MDSRLTSVFDERCPPSATAWSGHRARRTFVPPGLTAHADELNIDVDRIAIGGASAGGGITAALALLAHDRAEIRPVFQLLVYPMLDGRTMTRTDISSQRQQHGAAPGNGAAPSSRTPAVLRCHQ